MIQDVIRVFADRTNWTPDDDMAFIGDLPLEPFRPGNPDTPDRPTKLYGPEWKALNRKWSRPAAYMAGREAVSVQ